MKLDVSSFPLAAVPADWLILPVWEDGAQASDLSVLADRVERLRRSEDLKGKAGELVPVLEGTGVEAARILILGLGKKAEATRWGLTRAATAAAKHLAARQRRRVALVLPEAVPNLGWADLAKALVAGVFQGGHGPGIRQSEPGRFDPEELFLQPPAGVSESELRTLLQRAETAGRAVRLARDLVNEPPCDLYPESFARRAEELARQHGLDCTILDEKQLTAERMGCLLGVAQGSARPPRLAVLRHQRGRTNRTLALVGKGVTFDSGGLSLKTNEQMLDMKCDMAGAATVLAAAAALAEHNAPLNLLAVLPLVENLPGGRALKLGDVLRARTGKTVEVLNTDAEGRLILADALAYAVDQGASHLVDLATLTGACVVALGTEVAGLMTNDAGWGERVQAAVDRAGERAWPLPMFRDYGDLLKSPVADLKNVGGRWGGAILAAKFLENFVAGTPWVHLDIAGPAFVMDESPGRDAGGTGCLVRSLIELGLEYEHA